MEGEENPKRSVNIVEDGQQGKEVGRTTVRPSSESGLPAAVDADATGVLDLDPNLATTTRVFFLSVKIV